MSNREAAAEDLAIQETLSMTAQERLELLAELIVDKVTEDQQTGRVPLQVLLEDQSA